MPSPVAHSAVGYVIYRMLGPQGLQRDRGTDRGELRLAVAVITLSLLPDVDGMVGIILADIGRYHNNFAHAPLFGLLVALAVGGGVWLRHRSGFQCWFFLTLVCYELHILMDFFTDGRGVMLLWPFSWERFQPLVILFYGLQWSEGWVSEKHLWTLVTEMGFVLPVILLAHVVARIQSPRAEAPKVQKAHPVHPGPAH